MSTLNPTQAATQLAWVLAWTAHVDGVVLALQPADGVSPEAAFEAESLAIGARLVRNHALRTLAQPGVFVQLGSTDGGVGLVALALRVVLGGTSGPAPTTTEELLDSLEKDLPPDVLAQPPAVMARLLALLQHAANSVESQPCSQAQLLGYLSQFLRHHQDSLQTPSGSSLHGMAPAFMDYLSRTAPSASWEAVYKAFASSFEVQMALYGSDTAGGERVAELRELGNNLMANTCYPQAIMAYTEAVCCHGAAAHASRPQLLTNRALAYIGLNCVLEAVADLQRALAGDRTFTPAWAQLAYCHMFTGATLLALRCYLTALRTVAGEIYPPGLPEAAREQYTAARLGSVMPQFVQRLVLAIILCEKRAQQQRVSGTAAQEVTARARAILARLRSHVASEDVPYLSYQLDANIDNLRATAARANRVRPDILTPDVAQDLLTSTTVEASAVPLNPVRVVNQPLAPQTAQNAPRDQQQNTQELQNLTAQPSEQSGNEGTQPGLETAPAEGAPAPENTGNLRGLFNDLGELFGNVIQAGTAPPPGVQTQVTVHSDGQAPGAPANQQAPQPDLQSIHMQHVRQSQEALRRHMENQNRTQGQSPAPGQTPAPNEPSAPNQPQVAPGHIRVVTPGQPQGAPRHIRVVRTAPGTQPPPNIAADLIGRATAQFQRAMSTQNPTAPADTSGFGNIISQAIRNHLAAIRQAQAGRPGGAPNVPRQGPPTVQVQRPQTRSATSQGASDDGLLTVEVLENQAPAPTLADTIRTFTPGSRLGSEQPGTDTEMPDAPALD